MSVTRNERCPSVCGRRGCVPPEQEWGEGVGRDDLLFLSTVKRCRTLCGPFYGDSSGEIPIIYGYFGPNPEKYWPVKGYRTYLTFYHDMSRLFIELLRGYFVYLLNKILYVVNK